MEYVRGVFGIRDSSRDGWFFAEEQFWRRNGLTG